MKFCTNYKRIGHTNRAARAFDAATGTVDTFKAQSRAVRVRRLQIQPNPFGVMNGFFGLPRGESPGKKSGGYRQATRRSLVQGTISHPAKQRLETFLISVRGNSGLIVENTQSGDG